MEILGIGAAELIFVVIIALIVLGPKDMQKAGRTIGRWLNQLVSSDGWKVFQQTSRELRNLPTQLMREANMDLKEADRDIRNSLDPRVDLTAFNPSRSLSQENKADSTPQPSPAKSDATADAQASEDGTATKHD